MTTVEWLDGEHFQVLDVPSRVRWSDEPGVYLFVKLANGRYHALYVGQTVSLAARLPGHERWLAAARAGATQVHAKVVQLGTTRNRLEQLLIQRWNPPLNQQHNP